ncbi:MAG: hypothetical protein R3B90_23065 [Planctomycetaceae bacterium]
MRAVRGGHSGCGVDVARGNGGCRDQAAAASGEAGATPTLKPLPSPPPPPVELRAYRVLVALGFGDGPRVPKGLPNRLTLELRRQIDTRVGPLWEADVTEVPWLQPGSRRLLNDMTEADLNARFLPTDYDKVFLATVETEGGGYRISAREWDRNSQTSTAVTSRSEYESRVLGDRLFAEVYTHFRPLAEVETVSEDGKTIGMVVRGGELLPADPAAAPAEVGAYLAPYYRYYDRKKELRQLQMLEWTYLHVTGVERARVTAQLISTFQNPLAGSRRRVDLMAITLKPRFEGTELTVYPRGQPDNPVAGLRIDVTDREPTAEDKVEDRLVLYTGRQGAVMIPVNAGTPLQYLYILSGKSVLAEIPYIAGNAPTARLEVPDDGPRLGVEGEVEILEAELIELVARREVAMARALGLAKGKDWEAADRLVEEIKQLPTRESMLERVERMRLQAVDAARRTNNRVGEIRINKLCKTLVEHIERHLNPDRVRGFLQEYRVLKDVG